MKSTNALGIALVFGLTLFAWDSAFGQVPDQLTITTKVRDFNEDPDGAAPTAAGFHPDFNTRPGCSDTGYVSPTILETGSEDPNFQLDSRTPNKTTKLSSAGGTRCFESIAHFNDWYNDKPGINRSFLYDVVLNREPATGLYKITNNSFFPVDDGLVPGTTRPIIPGTMPFGHNSNNKTHNYGFTMEFHAEFTYLAPIASGPNARAAQRFDFSGDDDVWVFINGKLAIDLGGVHAQLGKSITLDAAEAARLGLVNNGKYILDFFIAERHVDHSNFVITTSIVLETNKVSDPIATPSTPVTTATPQGYVFASEVAVQLTTSTPGTTIRYTTDGTTPDSLSPIFNPAVGIKIIKDTELKAIAFRDEWLPSDVVTFKYTKVAPASVITILDENDGVVTFLSEKNAAYKVKLTTAQAGLTTVSADVATRIGVDTESVALTGPSVVNNLFEYVGLEPFSIATTAKRNGKTEAATYDTLIVKWKNPHVASDSVVKRVPIRPAPKQSRIYFSKVADGSSETNEFAGTETTIYVFVVDQTLPAGAKPQAVLTTAPKNGSGRLPDPETFDLVAVAPGLYRIAIPVDITPTRIAGDKRLQLAIEDIITANYTDPVDGDVAPPATAGFGVAPELEASLQFTNKAGVPISATDKWSPSEGFLYLEFKDDWMNGAILSKTVTLTIVNNGGRAPADLETFNVVLDSAKKVGLTGVWTGSIKLADLPGIAKNNGTAETYVLGQVHAEVTSHTKGGAASTKASDDLDVAYPNQEPVISIEGTKGPTVAISRNDSTVLVTIKDQSLSSVKDTVYFTLSCTGSKDVLINMMSIETSPGVYVSVPIPKSEGAVASDAILQCQSHDFVRVTYQDPVYGVPKSFDAEISNPVTPTLTFTSDPAGTAVINSVDDIDADFFYAVVKARSPSVANADTIHVTFTSNQGETETFVATETGPFTETFIAKVPFAFVTGAIGKGNGTVEGKITPTEVSNQVTITGKVTVDGTEATKTIDLKAAFAPVRKAYIKDTDGDGKGDKVYVEFEKRLGRLPPSLISQWNDTVSAGKTASGGKITFLGADSNIIVADYLGDEFGLGLTSPAAGQSPKATLPNDALFKGQRPVIEDSIGPVIISATKIPGKAGTTVADPSFNYDTLVVVLSEPLKTADFKQMLKFSSNCGDYDNAKTVTAVKNPNPTADKPNEYIIIVDKSATEIPNPGNCVFLNADPGKFTDVPGNQPPKFGKVLEGANSKPLINVFRGYPPVAGLDPNDPTFQVSVQDSRDSAKGGYSKPVPGATGYEVYWIPPVGFDASNPSAFTPKQFKLDDPTTGMTENKGPVAIPRNISAIQVVSPDPYIANVAIFDNHGNFLRKFTQAFGFQGEMQNNDRIVPKGLVSFLVWDMKDAKGQPAGNGVYVWKVVFSFKGGRQEVQYTRTGVMRKQ